MHDSRSHGSSTPSGQGQSPTVEWSILFCTLSVASKLLGQGCFDVLPVFIILLPEIASPQAGIWEQLPDRYCCACCLRVSCCSVRSFQHASCHQVCVCMHDVSQLYDCMAHTQLGSLERCFLMLACLKKDTKVDNRLETTNPLECCAKTLSTILVGADKCADGFRGCSQGTATSPAPRAVQDPSPCRAGECQTYLAAASD